jgi:hypothetical protein
MRHLLREYITIVIVESRLTDVKAKFPDINVDYFSENDPSGNNKYLHWMASQADKFKHRMHIESKIVDAVQRFHKLHNLLKNKDINSYATIDELTTAIQAASETSKTALKKQKKIKGADAVYSDANATIYYIKNKNACVLYGAGTKWCITSMKDEHWENYTDEGVLFYFIIRNEQKLDNFDKVAVAIAFDGSGGYTHEIYDAADNKIDVASLDNIFLTDDVTTSAMNAIVRDARKRETPIDVFKREHGYKGDVVEFLLEMPREASDEYNPLVFKTYVRKLMSNLDRDDLEKLTESENYYVVVIANKYLEDLESYGGRPEDWD